MWKVVNTVCFSYAFWRNNHTGNASACNPVDIQIILTTVNTQHLRKAFILEKKALFL